MTKSPNLAFEKSLWARGCINIAGIDEVGRGSWAGPVVAAAVILSKSFEIPDGFGESKQVKPQARKKLSQYIKIHAKAFSIAEVPVSMINNHGIGYASQVAFRKAVRQLDPRPDYILIDAFYIKHLNRKNQKAIIKGDEKCASIAAASVIAKVYRDDLMRMLAKKYPQYRFGKHKGYGTKLHQGLIRENGFSKIHRTSFNLKFLS